MLVSDIGCCAWKMMKHSKKKKNRVRPAGRTLKDPHTTAICTTGRSPMLGVRKTVFENQHGNCLSGLVTSTRLGRGSIKPHVRTVKVLGMGLFAFQEHVHLWQGVTYWTLYQSRVPRVLRPFGIHAHIACGRCGFAAQKASQKAYPAVCGEEKALLRKCNNLL